MSDTPTPVGRARELRRNMTKSELVLWKELRNRKFMGLKFVRQQPLIYQVIDNQPRYFIADFVCYEKRMIIEVDGAIHEFQKEEDEHRKNILRSLDFNILRIKNEEVKEIGTVMEKIRTYILKL
jgi:very-short-patch-repair endonuclease